MSVYKKQSKRLDNIAERKGFEPPVPVRAQLLSREPRSTTLAPLQYVKNEHSLNADANVG